MIMYWKIFLHILGVTFTFLAFAILLHVIYFPDSPLYIISIFPKELWISKFFQVSYLILFSQVLCYIHVTCVIQMQLISFSFLMTYGFICNELRLRRNPYKGYKFSDKMRTANELRINYRIIQVFYHYFMSLFGLYIVPFQGLVGQMLVHSIYSIISHRKYLDFISASITIFAILIGLGSLGFVLSFGRIVFKESKKTVSSWKWHGKWNNELDAKVMKRFVKSCKPIATGLPGYFRITHVTFLTFLRAVVKNIFRALLAFK
jgi:hypothetical protein